METYDYEFQEEIVQFIVTLEENNFLEFVKGNIDQISKNSNQWSHVSGHLSTNLTLENCFFYYQLAVEAKDDQLQEQIVRFVAECNPPIATLCVTEGFQQTTAQNIKDILTRCTELLNKTTDQV